SRCRKLRQRIRILNQRRCVKLKTGKAFSVFPFTGGDEHVVRWTKKTIAAVSAPGRSSDPIGEIGERNRLLRADGSKRTRTTERVGPGRNRFEHHRQTRSGSHLGRIPHRAETSGGTPAGKRPGGG